MLSLGQRQIEKMKKRTAYIRGAVNAQLAINRINAQVRAGNTPGGASPEYGQTLLTLAAIPVATHVITSAIASSAVDAGGLSSLAKNTAGFLGRQAPTITKTVNITKGGGLLAGGTLIGVGVGGIIGALLFGGQTQNQAITQTPTQTNKPTQQTSAINRNITISNTPQKNITNWTAGGDINSSGYSQGGGQTTTTSPSSDVMPTQSSSPSQDTGATQTATQNSSLMMIAIIVLAAIMLMDGDKNK